MGCKAIAGGLRTYLCSCSKSTIRSMLLDYLTISGIQAAEEKAAQEKEAFHDQVGHERWIVTGSNVGVQARPSKAGDLSNFGKIRKSQPIPFGPGSVFAGKKAEVKESNSRTAPSSNMFSLLSNRNAETSDTTSKCMFSY